MRITAKQILLDVTQDENGRIIKIMELQPNTDKPQVVSHKSIAVSPRLDWRKPSHEETVQLADAVQAGKASLRPVILFNDGKGWLYLASGYDQYLAVLRANTGGIPATIYSGTQEDAESLAVSLKQATRKPEEVR